MNRCKKIINSAFLQASLFSAVLLALLLSATPARAQEVVLAFEDVLGPSATLDGMARTQMIISGLRRAEVNQAIFFVRTKKVNAKTKPRLVQYDKAGHVLASQGHDHNYFKKVNLYAYEIDLLKSSAILEEFPNYRGYFRFGYYSAGGDLDLRRKLKMFALENNLQPAYATSKPFDWYLNQKYLDRVNSNRRVDMAALETVYVDMIWRGLERYNHYALSTYGHDIKHVLLLQENDLAAYFIAPLVEKIRAEGWRVATPDSAFGYPKVNRPPIALHKSDGFMAALAGIDVMANDVPLMLYQNKSAVDAIPGVATIFPSP